VSNSLKILLALLVGLGAGYFGHDLLTSSTSEPLKRRDGDGGLTPCQAAASLPPGQWSNVPCGSSQGCAILDQIQSLALADANAGRMGPGQLAQLNDLLIKCAMNTAPVQLGGSEHCQKLNAAKQAAMQHDWALCIEQMLHGH
jgi:hypothetical protein